MDQEVTFTFAARANLDKFFKRKIVTPMQYIQKSLEKAARLENPNYPTLIQSLYLNDKKEINLENVQEYNFDYFEMYDRLYTSKETVCWGPLRKDKIAKLKTYIELRDYLTDFYNKMPPIKKEEGEEQKWKRVMDTSSRQFCAFMKKEGSNAIHIVKETKVKYSKEELDEMNSFDREDAITYNTYCKDGEVAIQSRMLHPNTGRVVSIFSIKDLKRMTRFDVNLVIGMPIYPLGDLGLFMRPKHRHSLIEELGVSLDQFMKYSGAQVLMALDYIDKLKVAHLDLTVIKI